MQSLYDVPLRFYENSTGNCPVGSQGMSGYLMLCLLHGLIWQLPCEDVSSFQYAYAVPQHLFPSRVALIFCQHPVLMTVLLEHSVKSSLHSSKSLSGVNVRIHDVLCSLNYSFSFSVMNWNCHQGRGNPLMEKSGHNTYSDSQLTS